MEAYNIGLDFGTCNIKVATYEYDDEPELRKIDQNMSSDAILPNVIKYKQNRNNDHVDKLMGTEHILNIRSGEVVVKRIKRKLEQKKWEIKVPGLGFLSAEDVTKDIFTYIARELENQEGKELGETVITVPVCFTEIQKNKIIQAAKASGFKVKRVVTESFASLFANNLDDLEGNVITIDLGGATTDITLFEITHYNDNISIKEIASYGLDYGGTNITDDIYKYCIYPKKKELLDKLLLSANDDRDILGEIITEVEKAKTRMFSKVRETDYEECVFLEFGDINSEFSNIEISFSYQEVLDYFAKIDLNGNLFSSLDKLLDEGNTDIEDVKKVFITGGTGSIKYLRDCIEEYFANPEVYKAEKKYREDKALEAVAKGAANYLRILQNGEGRVTIENSIPFSIGVEDEKTGLFKKVTNKNMPLDYRPFTKQISCDTLEKCDWRLNLFQTFNTGDEIFINEDNCDKGAVYLGYLPLDKSKYVGQTKVFYEIYANEETIRCSFKAKLPDSGRIEVENVQIVLGGGEVG